MDLIKNLRIGYGLSVLLLLISGISSLVAIRNYKESARWVNHTRQVLLEAENTQSLLTDAEAGQRSFLLTGETSYLRRYNYVEIYLNRSLESLRELTSDNASQAPRLDSVQQLLAIRLDLLRKHVETRKNGVLPSNAELAIGSEMTEKVRTIIGRIKGEEERLLSIRVASLNAIGNYTPIIVIFASLLALLITIYSYMRLSADFRARSILQQDLIRKDREISDRIDIISEIAGKISAGDFSTRVNDAQQDGLGELSGSLNKMAESLDHSFARLSEKEWMQSGIAGLNDKMLGEMEVEHLADNIVEFIASYTGAHTGALYVADNRRLSLSGSYALTAGAGNRYFSWGEGQVGECAASGKPLHVKGLPTDMLISFANGRLQSTEIILYPFYYEKEVKAVLELGTATGFVPQAEDYLQSISMNVGIAINSAQTRQRIQSLLEEVQAQTEELQAQHAELENNNTELEAQSMKLQASEEELRVQQEELLQANQELEERSRLLEERNRLIAERNLEIRQKADDLAESSKYKSEFMANMSHELRTPLNSILLLSRLLSENSQQNLNPEQIESALVIQSSGLGLLQLIDEILDLSKIEAGKMDLEYAPMELDKAVNHMRQLFMPMAAEKKLDFRIDKEQNLPASIETDEQRLEQILKNLLANAFKFTKVGSVTLGIRPATSNPSFIEFYVRDTGIGIPADKQQLVFEAFQQADGSTRRKFGGTGLGLSISRELARLLGGQLTVSSEPGKGSEFVLSVPSSPSRSAASKIVTDSAGEETELDEELKKKKQPANPLLATHFPEDIPDDRKNCQPGDNIILIVEDDVVVAKNLLEYTRNAGYKAIVAVRGDQAKDLALTYQPLAILLDIVLPVKDGWSVMEELKADPRLRSIPVHVMSSLEAKKESLRRGAIDFVNKPLAAGDMQAIFKKLEAVIQKEPGKVLIVEENTRHAQALAYFLDMNRVNAEVRGSIKEGVHALMETEIECVILDMGVPDKNGYETLEEIKNNPGLENLPIIVFTGKQLSKSEEAKIKKYADSIVVKTVHSYRRILDEVGLFLHLVETAGVAASSRASGPGLSTQGEELKGHTVLITDDDVRNIYSLTRALEACQMKVLSAMDGQEALQVLQDNPQVDLVLMDIMMPGMDGFEAIRQIRRQPRYRNLPVLAVTAKSMLGDREKCMKAGASDYISKPVDIDQLTSLLRVWLYDKN